MYSSYGSYSFIQVPATAPMDIATSFSANDNAASCAFPSWPRRSSLSESEEERPTSFLSDDDLFPCDPFEDDARSVSSASSSGTPPLMESPPTHFDSALQEMERQRAALQRDYVRNIVFEKERRRIALKKQQLQRKAAATSSSSSGKKRSKSTTMTPIAEALE